MDELLWKYAVDIITSDTPEFVAIVFADQGETEKERVNYRFAWFTLVSDDTGRAGKLRDAGIPI